MLKYLAVTKMLNYLHKYSARDYFEPTTVTRLVVTIHKGT
jgi:hypothetical protein